MIVHLLRVEEEYFALKNQNNSFSVCCAQESVRYPNGDDERATGYARTELRACPGRSGECGVQEHGGGS